MADEDVEKVWNEFWWPTIAAAAAERQGAGQQILPRALTIEEWDQIKRELFDWHNVINVVPAVYSYATGGRMSKPTYNDVSQITGCIDEHYEEGFNADVAEAIVRSTDDVDMSDPAIRDAVEIVLQNIQDGLGVPAEDLEAAAKDWERLKENLQEIDNPSTTD